MVTCVRNGDHLGQQRQTHTKIEVIHKPHPGDEMKKYAIRMVKEALKERATIMKDGNILEYKGYRGKVEFDSEALCLYGKIIGINALVTFESDSPKTIEQAFKDSVDEYIELCKLHGLKPEKEYNGQFNVRIQPETHRKLSLIAEARGEKLNTVVNAAFEHYVE